MKEPVQLGEKLFLIDTYDLGLPGRTGCYVFVEETGVHLIETSASPSKPYIEQGLHQLGYDRSAIKTIILTHIHLDHAGGAGLFAQDCPNATFIVHPKGIRHLADPSRLIKGAEAVYGDKFHELFHPILPIPEAQMKALENGETLSLGEDRELTFIDSPGHARHHYSVYDPLTKGMFTGDTIGVRYATLEERGTPLFLPSTSPNQFDPEAMRDSMKRIQSFSPERIYFGHYSMSENVSEVYRQIDSWLDDFLEITEAELKKGSDHERLARAIGKQVFSRSAAHTLPEDHPERQMIEVDLLVCSMGLIDYFHRKTTSK